MMVGMTLYCFLGSELTRLLCLRTPDDGAGGQGVGRPRQSPWSGPPGEGLRTLVVVPTKFPAESQHQLAGQAWEPSSTEIADNGIRSLSSTAHYHLTLITAVS